MKTCKEELNDIIWEAVNDMGGESEIALTDHVCEEVFKILVGKDKEIAELKHKNDLFSNGFHGTNKYAVELESKLKEARETIALSEYVVYAVDKRRFAGIDTFHLSNRIEKFLKDNPENKTERDFPFSDKTDIVPLDTSDPVPLKKTEG